MVNFVVEPIIFIIGLVTISSCCNGMMLWFVIDSFLPPLHLFCFVSVNFPVIFGVFLQELDQAILKVTQLDPRVFVRTTNLHHSAPQVPSKRNTSNGRNAHFISTNGGSAISNSTFIH